MENQETQPIGLTTKEAAKALRVSVRTLLSMIQRGLPARKVGREWRISPAALEAWIASGNCPSSDKAGAEARQG